MIREQGNFHNVLVFLWFTAAKKFHNPFLNGVLLTGLEPAYALNERVQKILGNVLAQDNWVDNQLICLSVASKLACDVLSVSRCHIYFYSPEIVVEIVTQICERPKISRRHITRKGICFHRKRLVKYQKWDTQ